jgi:serine/threonine protein kinase
VSELPTASGGLAAGSQIAGYTIEGQIGRGGMAVVYRASDGRLNRAVALKILAPELAGDTAFRQRFIREMRAAASVDHPNIVPVFDAGEADGELFIAMRYVSGQDVRTLLDAEHRLTAARVAHLIAQAASALDEAHARGLVHRDVKPGNMLIGSGQPDHLYLSDFGLSKQRVSSAQLTLTGQFLGTLDYMAPEQIEGHEIDGRADLYALGCTAFEMLAGEPPFRRDQGLAVLWAQVSAPAPSLQALRPDLPPAVDEVIARALAKSPDDRYPSCTAFARALATACGIGGQASHASAVAPAPPAGPPTEMARLPASHAAESWPTDPQPPAAPSWPPAPPLSTQYPPNRATARRRRRKWPLAACIVLLAIAGAGLVLLYAKHSPGQPGPARPATPGKPSTAAPAGPAATVQAYIAAINAHDYAKAWALGGKSTGSSYSSFTRGFNGTARDNLTVVSVAGNVVTVKLAATQTDGSVNSYQGTYTVTGGVITQSRIQPAG